MSEWIITLMLGLCFGSFNTMLIHRLPKGFRICMDRSACPRCGHVLGVADLVPLFSWLCARARCRHCAAPIHWRYPVTELITAALFALCYMVHGFTWEALLLALFGSQIIVLCAIDFAHRIIPDELQLSMGATGIAYGMLSGTHIANMLLAMLAGGAFGFALQAGFKWWKKIDGLGTGDVKFMAVCGVWFGNLMLFLPYFFYSGVLGIVCALIWRCFNSDPRFPFGPALAISAFTLVCYPPSEYWFTALSARLVTQLGII